MKGRASPGGFGATLAGARVPTMNPANGEDDFTVARRRERFPVGGVKLHVLPAGPIQTNAYLLTDAKRGEAVLIDAPGSVWADVEPILREEKCKLAELWLTHGHWDHTQGGAEIVRATGARVLAHADDRIMIETPEVMERFMGERMNLEPVKVDRWVKQGDRIEILGTTVEVRCRPRALRVVAPAPAA